MASTLPRGIQLIRKPSNIYFRVKVNRIDFKADKYFKDLNEAKEFLALSKASKGQKLIYSIDKEQEQLKQINFDNENFKFGYFIDLYIQDYVKPATNELQTRNRNNKLSFLKTIKNTSVIDRTITHEEKESMGFDTLSKEPIYRLFSEFDVRKIKAIDINNYIKSRLNFVKPISVSRELTYISNIFRKLVFFNESLEHINNPMKSFDKDLLGSYTITKRETILSEELEKLIYDKLQEKENKDLYKIAKVSLLTAMRRSEIVYLNKEQVKSSYVQLIHTKSKKPRKVWLTPEARDFINSLEVQPDGRYFKYTIGGFDKMMTDFFKSINMHKTIRFHDLRRTNISRLLTKIGQGNTVLATEILGLQSLRKFEELHVSSMTPTEPLTQAQAMQSIGHGSSQNTKTYFNIVLEKKP